MTRLSHRARSVVLRNAVRAGLVALVVGVALLTRLPSYSAAEQHRLAAAFQFVRHPLASASSAPNRYVRAVEPQLYRIRSWISSVGAAVAVGDFDDDGLPNDLCLVDTRTNSVTVEPVPGTGQRYRPFLLNPTPLRYDTRSMAPMGCLPGDFNEDGWRDFLVYYWGRTPVLFIRRPQTALGASAFVRRELVAGAQRWYTDSVTQADIDGDGHLDLVIGNYFPDDSRVLDARAAHDSAMQTQDSMSRAYNGGKDRILLWSGPSRYREAVGALPAKVADGWTLAIGAADLNGDLRPELYFANDFGPDRLLYNESTPGHVRFITLTGHRSFFTPASEVLGTDSFKGMGVDFGDVNENGRLDIFVSNITAQFALEESNFLWMNTGVYAAMAHGAAPFTDHSEQLGLARSGWSWDAKFGDFRNDGRLEIVQATGFIKGKTNRWPQLHELAMGNDTLLHLPGVWPRFAPGDDLSGHEPNAFWVRGPAGRYVNLARDVGLGQPFVTRGVATADVNGDGRLDFAIANQWEQSYFYLNRSPHTGRFLGLQLLLPARDKHSRTRVLSYPAPGLQALPAVGAEAIVHLANGRRVLAEIDGGNGHASVRAPEMLVGLGSHSRAKLVTDLVWRDGSGHAHRLKVALRPGWHTILLAQR